MDKAKRAVIAIAGIEVEVYQMPDGEYVMSQRQVGRAIGVDHKTMGRFLDEKWLEGKLDKNLRRDKIAVIDNSKRRGGFNKSIKFIPINLASEFWFEQAIKGNLKAQGLMRACMEEALRRRCDKAFSVAKTEEEYENETSIKYQTWVESRSFLRDAHASFLNCCRANDFIPGVAHDKITRAICGMTARELRELELIEGSEKIGLNHVPDKDTLVKIAKLKLEFARLRTGNVDERIARALKVL